MDTRIMRGIKIWKNKIQMKLQRSRIDKDVERLESEL